MTDTLSSVLTPKIRAHADKLECSLDLVEDLNRGARENLATWISAQLDRGSEARIIVVCTGNSRRSVLGSVMGNIAAAYHGCSNVSFYSGGTAPSAFNNRTVRALTDIGVEITATGAEAARGDPETPNPIYRVRWGSGECLEFSKRYDDPRNPQRGFAAILVCTEADGECPSVPGASIRLSCPFEDPKDADDSSEEATRYAERRDQIGRFMLAVFRQVKD